MNVVRSVIRDLVDRKLWPVALLLVVAVAAVPMLLGSGEEPATTASGTPQGVAGPAAPAAAGQDSEVDARHAGRRTRHPQGSRAQPVPPAGRHGRRPIR